MSENSKIEWTDHTFNPWIGCAKVSAGCANCYAETQDKFRSWTPEGWGKGKPRKRTSVANWKLPLKWNAGPYGLPPQICDCCGQLYGFPGACLHTEKLHRPRVFSASLADWLDDEVPIEWLADFLLLIAQTPNLDWLLLSKRPENFKARLEAAYSAPGMGSEKKNADWIWHWANGYGCVPPNVWIGTTVENQEMAEQRIPQLLRIPAKVRFLSCEPLLSELDFYQASLAWPNETHPWKNCPVLHGIHWVIVGGESGPNARPVNPDWVRSLRNQCETAKVAFFFKQWGEWVRDAEIHTHAAGESRIVPYGAGHPENDFRRMYRVGKKSAGRKLDGIEHNAMPV